jgi:hypothetical protein
MWEITLRPHGKAQTREVFFWGGAPIFKRENRHQLKGKTKPEQKPQSREKAWKGAFAPSPLKPPGRKTPSKEGVGVWKGQCKRGKPKFTRMKD